MAIPDQPLEILRTLHSFDPCLACSAHVLGDDGSELIAVRTLSVKEKNDDWKAISTRRGGA